MSKIKIAILGYGGRGRVYARLCVKMASKYSVIAVIDNNADKLTTAKRECNLSDKQVFSSLDDFLAAKIEGDYLAVCTQDSDHILHAIPALKAGYNLLLEKPIACSAKDCLEIARVAKECNKKVAVCHVLRYSDYYITLKKVMDSGVLGKVISIEQEENIGYWHMAHSYVRGDWAQEEQSNPIILAKTCHDLDIAVYLTDSLCESVSSMGSLNYFKAENAPDGTTEYCVGGCKAKNDCPYDAEKIYLKPILRLPNKFIGQMWPQSRLVSDGVVTIDKVKAAIKNTRYGKCVFKCSNNVCDHQVTTMTFKNGVTSTLIMSAFSDKIYRETRIRGSKGELIANMETSDIRLKLYGEKSKKIRMAKLDSHGGGDFHLIQDLADNIIRTDINMSIESHLIGFAAELSRKQGRVVKLDEIRNN